METEIKGKKAQITPGQEIVLTNSKELKDTVDNLVAKDVNDICLDFKNVQEIDSAGLGKILLINKIINDNDGELVIKNIQSKYVKKVFHMVQLDEIVDIQK